jgi:hypothetical protein
MGELGLFKIRSPNLSGGTDEHCENFQNSQSLGRLLNQTPTEYEEILLITRSVVFFNGYFEV